MIGSGAAGSVFACYLKKGGADLWLVDRYQAHMDKVAAEGMTFVTPEGEQLLTGFNTAYTAENIGIMDVVILMVKATQTDNIMPSLFGGLGVVYISKNWKVSVAPFVFMIILFVSVPSLASSVGVLVPVGILIALGVSRLMYKKGWL